MPPSENTPAAVTPAEIGSPAVVKRPGSQLTKKYNSSRFMKNGIQSSRVPGARPSVNRYLTGMPGHSGQVPVYRRPCAGHPAALDSVLHESAAVVFLRQLAPGSFDDGGTADFRGSHRGGGVFARRHDRQPDSREGDEGIRRVRDDLRRVLA